MNEGPAATDIWDQHREHRAVSDTNQTCAVCEDERFPCREWEHALAVLATHHGIPLYVPPSPQSPGGALSSVAAPSGHLPTGPYTGTGYPAPRPGP